MDMQKHQEYVDQLSNLFGQAAAKDVGVEPEIQAIVAVTLTLVCEFMQDGKRIADTLERQNALTAEMLQQQGYHGGYKGPEGYGSLL